jgi:hypothetical protein
MTNHGMEIAGGANHIFRHDPALGGKRFPALRHRRFAAH